MYAVIETGGKQYRVSPDASVKVETLSGERGTPVVFDRVLAVVSDDGVLKTGPEVAAARVSGTIESQGRAPKVIVFKFKRKKQYKKTIGHRQNFTEVKITAIETEPQAPASEPAAEESGS
jgi:large subunit ribosomal protein L21